MTRSTPTTRIAVTGGPGAGKTALLTALADQGQIVVPETARSIIAGRKARGLNPRPPALQFAREILETDVAQYRSVPEGAEVVFFDRSIIDALGMLAELGRLAETERSGYLRRYPYHPTALILPPWPDIYHADSERDQTEEEAERVYHSLRRWYAACGFALCEVPRATLEDRCRFVLQFVENIRFNG